LPGAAGRDAAEEEEAEAPEAARAVDQARASDAWGGLMPEEPAVIVVAPNAAIPSLTRRASLVLSEVVLNAVP